ncbi:hypothetical protein [Sulfurovum sp.]|jgi:hypothetical protein|uniref:hypothetical protein n=1 Tax=Sulfurovum sp. TaxID=1969726 RepID=UPI002A37211F|nr:hypothetical protein [Sulfurovum sp.]MDD2451318.1 hypothetical protein [Sulfurovum sp.]MDD3499389.1 hypothetical protein [Sulfurovum sp.]MDY0402343.1 hypothetical protein [Sulfurovum sp.]
MKSVMIEMHEIWLETMMAGFMSSGEKKEQLFDFAAIFFRHFTWLENELIEIGEAYNYDRNMMSVQAERLSDLLHRIIKKLGALDLQLESSPDRELAHRISSDIRYITGVMMKMKDERVEAFNRALKYPGVALSEEATKAFTRFLFEESYKEYELILIYNYLKAHSDDAYLNRIFQILIDESHFHFKSFGNMMAKMGILSVPRIVMKELYQVEDVVQFLKDGIEEELAAKEECRALSEAVGKDSAELAAFFDFINMQEDYHITLMKDALQHYTKKETDV